MRPLPLVLILAFAAGCQNTGAGNDPLLPDELVRRAIQGSSFTTFLATEVGLLASDPPEGFASCPRVEQEGDVFSFNYGPDGCVPDSGLTTDTVRGMVELTVAGGSGAFLGTVTDLGVDGSRLTGSVSGSSSTAGDLLTLDFDVSAADWTRADRPHVLDLFLEIVGNSEEISAFVDSGILTGEDGEDTYFDLEDVATPRAELGGCFVPASGEISLFRELGRGTVIFSEDTHSSGQITATYNDRDPSILSPCE